MSKSSHETKEDNAPEESNLRQNSQKWPELIILKFTKCTLTTQIAKMQKRRCKKGEKSRISLRTGIHCIFHFMIFFITREQVASERHAKFREKSRNSECSGFNWPESIIKWIVWILHLINNKNPAFFTTHASLLIRALTPIRRTKTVWLLADTTYNKICGILEHDLYNKFESN